MIEQLEMVGTSATFTVVGDPAPKGSAKAFIAGSRAIITHDSKRTKPWQHAVHWTAREHAPEQPWEGPVGVEIVFQMPRPGRLGKRRAGVRCDHRPDVDKCARTVLDALTGVFWVDDGQVSDMVVRQRYADFGMPSGATISARRLPPEASA